MAMLVIISLIAGIVLVLIGFMFDFDSDGYRIFDSLLWAGFLCLGFFVGSVAMIVNTEEPELPKQEVVKEEKIIKEEKKEQPIEIIKERVDLPKKDWTKKLN